MASSKLCAGTDRRIVPALAASNAGVLPLDAVYEILLRLPAKELCGLRTVCRPWRSLLSDPKFAAAHAVHHPEPLIIVSYEENSVSFENEDSDEDNTKHESIVSIMDLSGHIVKKMRIEDHRVMSMPLNLVCVKKVQDGNCRLVNPATGVVYHVPKDLAEEHVALKLNPYDYNEDLYLFGRVASTGEYKVLRKVMFSHDDYYGFLYEVCTLSSSRHARWRKMQGHPDIFGWSETGSVIIDGVAYFLIGGAFLAAVFGNQAFERDCVASFDLEMEEWRPNIKGPQSIFLHNAVDMHNNHDKPNRKQLTLANLNGSLVMVHGPAPYMDLWFLVDYEKGLWVKQYSIQVERYGDLLPMYPLSVLEDGRIVILIRYTQLEIYDPRTHTFTNVLKVSHCPRISMYTGNLLSLEW